MGHRYQKTNNEGSGSLRYTIIFHYMPDGNVPLTLVVC